MAHSPESNAQPLLALLQLTDSALPIGAYSHSWGLETLVQNGTIASAASAASAISNLLKFSLAPREGVAAALAYRFQVSPNRVNNRNSLATINNYLSASLWAAETHDASIKMGERLLRLAETLGWYEDIDLRAFDSGGIGSAGGISDAGGNSSAGGISDAGGISSAGAANSGLGQNKYTCHHSVAIGFLGAKLGIKLQDLIPAYLLSSVAALVAALVKLVPLGHTDGQRILAGSHEQIAEMSKLCLAANLEDLGGFAPISEWGAAVHQSLYTRLFQS